ncbi:hypothetical protein ACLB2K_064260 [Fragaria x ananassa]
MQESTVSRILDFKCWRYVAMGQNSVILLSKLPAEHNETLLKNIEICRFCKLDTVSSDIMKVVEFSGFSKPEMKFALPGLLSNYLILLESQISDESFKQWEGLIELLGSESKTTVGV